MQLTLFSDYALRVTLYLGAHPDRVCSVDEVSRAYGISKAHLVKVVQRLAELELVGTTRGRNGGLRLARAPEDINVGALVRETERFDIVECFDGESNTCPISASCTLKGTLARAKKAFLAVLDEQSVADLLPRPQRLVTLWAPSLRGRGRT